MLNKNILYVFALSMLFFACEEKTFDPSVQFNAAPVLTSPTTGSSFDLVADAAATDFTEFTWTEADFGYQAAITYTVEIDLVGNNFAETAVLGPTRELSVKETVGLVNNILLARGLPADFENELEVRVCAEISDNVESFCSDPIRLTINPFPAAIDYPFLTVAGNYQGWNETDTTRVVFSRKSDNIYDGFIYFPIDNALYKYVQGLSWDDNWGDEDPADGVLEYLGFGNDIPIPDGAGMYFLTADLNSLAHSAVKTSWAVIGDATPGGWDAGTEFVWDEEREVLSVTLDLVPGELRFRANGSDDINFGDNFNNGTLEADGDNIPVTEAGNYTIDLNLMIADYEVVITKN